MANRKKANKAAIDFSVEMSTPTPAPKPATAKKPKKKVNVAGVIPAKVQADRDAAVPEHPKAAASKAKRQEELSSGISEARMPKQDEFEARQKPKYTQEYKAEFEVRQKQEADKRQQEIEEDRKNPHPFLKLYTTFPATPKEAKSASKISAGLTKAPRLKGKK